MRIRCSVFTNEKVVSAIISLVEDGGQGRPQDSRPDAGATTS
jgi:hypothetical protein